MIRALKEKLEREVQDLQRELHLELPREIDKARKLGDLRENAEYQMALERQSYVQARIGQLMVRLSKLSTMNFNNLPHGKIAFGSTVTLMDLDSGARIVYDLVMSDGADTQAGEISIGSPIARGLLGREVGEEVEILIPSGRKKFEIVDLQTIHDKAAGNGDKPA